MERKIDFVINSQEKIQFIFVTESEEDRCFDQVDVIYVNNAQNLSFVLCKNLYIFMALWGLRGKLEAVLKNELDLHPSIKKDIGYLASNLERVSLAEQENTTAQVSAVMHDNSGDLEFTSVASTPYWVGNSYRFQWWGGHGVSTWLYQKNGKIILEITPDYNSGAQHSNYKEFMANYKVILLPFSRQSKFELY